MEHKSIDKKESISNNITTNFKEDKVHKNPRKQIVCFYCKTDYNELPNDSKEDGSAFPDEIFADIVNVVSSELGLKNKSGSIVKVTNSYVTNNVRFCMDCFTIVLQLYHMLRSPHKTTKIALERITYLKDILKVKLKKKNPKLQLLINAISKKTQYDFKGQVALDYIGSELVNRVRNPIKFKKYVAELDLRNLSDFGMPFDENMYLMLEYPKIEPKKGIKLDLCLPNTSPEVITPPTTSRFENSDPVEEKDKAPQNLSSVDAENSRFAPVNMVNHSMNTYMKTPDSNQDDSMSTTNALNDEQLCPPLLLPMGEIKLNPRKQVLANRVGVSAKIPVIRTITKEDKEAKSKSLLENSVESNRTVLGAMEPTDEEETCQVCGIAFANHKSYLTHLQQHRRPFCEFCRQYFHSEAEYFKHRDAKHPPKSMYECFICPVKYKMGKKLLFHLRTHKNVNTYRCCYTECGKTFRNKVDCVDHLNKCEHFEPPKKRNKKEIDEDNGPPILERQITVFEREPVDGWSPNLESLPLPEIFEGGLNQELTEEFV